MERCSIATIPVSEDTYRGRGQGRLTNTLPEGDSLPKRGLCAVTCDANGVAVRLRLLNGEIPLQPQEAKLKYFANNWRLRLGAESYFFEERQADKFAGAKYGGLRIDADGNSVLTGLYDAARHLIIP